MLGKLTVMPALSIEEYARYEEFTDTWEGSETDTRLVWQLLGLLDADELLIELPHWLAEEKIGFVEGATPTLFVGHIERETEKAIQFGGAVAARPLMKLAHRISELEQNEGAPERNEWLDKRLAEHRAAFDRRDDAVGLVDEWLPKSQILLAVRRAETANSTRE